jgi:hypothetical protein
VKSACEGLRGVLVSEQLSVVKAYEMIKVIGVNLLANRLNELLIKHKFDISSRPMVR